MNEESFLKILQHGVRDLGQVGEKLVQQNVVDIILLLACDLMDSDGAQYQFEINIAYTDQNSIT